MSRKRNFCDAFGDDCADDCAQRDETNLPEEIWHHVIRFCQLRDLVSIAATCKDFRDLVFNDPRIGRLTAAASLMNFSQQCFFFTLGSIEMLPFGIIDCGPLLHRCSVGIPALLRTSVGQFLSTIPTGSRPPFPLVAHVKAEVSFVDSKRIVVDKAGHFKLVASSKRIKKYLHDRFTVFHRLGMELKGPERTGRPSYFSYYVGERTQPQLDKMASAIAKSIGDSSNPSLLFKMIKHKLK